MPKAIHPLGRAPARPLSVRSFRVSVVSLRVPVCQRCRCLRRRRRAATPCRPRRLTCAAEAPLALMPPDLRPRSCILVAILYHTSMGAPHKLVAAVHFVDAVQLASAGNAELDSALHLGGGLRACPCACREGESARSLVALAPARRKRFSILCDGHATPMQPRQNVQLFALAVRRYPTKKSSASRASKEGHRVCRKCHR